MSSRNLTQLTLAALWMFAACNLSLLAQSGWVSTVNPGWVSRPATGAAPPSLSVPYPGPVLALPPGQPGARLGKARSGEAAITTQAPRVLVHPNVFPLVYPGPVPNPYVYPTYGVVTGVAPPEGTNQVTRPSPEGSIFIGMTRTAVIETLGRPSAIVYRASHETLVFTGTTIIIQNGVVAVIQ